MFKESNVIFLMTLYLVFTRVTVSNEFDSGRSGERRATGGARVSIPVGHLPLSQCVIQIILVLRLILICNEIINHNLELSFCKLLLSFCLQLRRY